MNTPRYVEERNKVLLGNLPDDFLRFSDPNQARTQNGPSQVSQVSSQQHQQQMPGMMTDQITICVIEATLVKNYSITKMDPYVRLRVGHSVFETFADLNGGKVPKWNKTFSTYLPNGIKTLHFEVYDEKTLTPDERIAYADYVIPEDGLKGQFLDVWIPLSGKQGFEKEGSLHATIYIKSVPYWQTYAPQAPVMVMPQPILGFSPYYVQGPVAVQYAQQPMQNPSYRYPVQPQQPQPYQPQQPQPYQTQQPQPYQPKEEEIKQIQEMFPHFDREVILSVLENSQGNKDQAITSLLSLSDK